MSIKGDLIAVGVAAAIVAAALWYAKKKLGDAGAAAQEILQDAWTASTDAAVAAGDAVIAKPAIAIGDVMGVPRTNETECQRAMREGRTWDSSFACDAGTFIKYLWN